MSEKKVPDIKVTPPGPESKKWHSRAVRNFGY